MKLLELNLKAVGPFSGVVLDLGGGEQGLHLIFGPNEAGKTSTLRALSFLLFGFPQRSTDNFVHPNEQLRIGGRLRHSSGERLEIVRRRGLKNTLRGSDDLTIVADDHLARFLGGINQDTFETMFGIDHERLTKAGEEIRTGQGQLGELLFAAASGLAGLSQGQQRLQKELDELFRPRGQNQRINKSLAELRGVQEELKRSQLSSEEWQKHERAYHETMKAAELIGAHVRTARSRQGALKRIRSAMPLVATHRRLTTELNELGNVIRLRDDFGDELRKAQDRLREAEPTIARSRATLQEIDSRLAQLDPAPLLLETASEIESLQERLGAVEKANHDHVRLERFQQDAEHQARRILRDLARPVDLDEAETLRLRADEPMIIRRLAQQFAQLRGQAEAARKIIARHADQIKRQETELAELEKTLDVEPLRRAVSQARKAGDLDVRLGEIRRQLVLADKRAKTALTQLPGWACSAEELVRLAVPLLATLDQFESRLEEMAQQQRSITERIAQEDHSIHELESRLQSLELERDVPTEEVLLAARRRRDQGWQFVKATWLDRTPASKVQEAFIAEFGPHATLASAYEQSVAHTDALGDRLRREADRVAHKAEALSQLHRHRTACVTLVEHGQALEEHKAQIEHDWNALVGPLAIKTELRTPAELRAWLRQREQAVQLVEKADELRHTLEPLEQTFNTKRAIISRILAEMDEPVPASNLELADILDRSDALIKRHDELTQRRTKLETKVATSRSELTAAELSLQAANVELAAWQTEWSVLMTRIGLEADAMPEQAEVFLNRISELLEKLTDRRNAQSRIRGMDRDAEEFARDVKAVAARVARDLLDRPASELARELAQCLRETQADAKQRTTLINQRQREQDTLDTANAQYEQARVCLERLCNEAKCTDFGDLVEAERRSHNLIRLQAARATCEEQLLAAAAGAELAAFCYEVEGADPGTVDASIEELDATIATQEEELRQLDQTIGSERGELARMDGSDRAAQAAENVQTLLARLQGDVARYATLKLAAMVMHHGIEQYREKNQGPILGRASVLFAALTGNSFTRLQIDDNGDGRSILKGVRPDGRLVGIDGMSDGSHDQLYLALRLASLESWLQSHEPVPFVVDDILLNFDDARATAALTALAELSRQTQVLFFTHHRHIVELACTHLPGEVVYIHELPRSRHASSTDLSEDLPSSNSLNLPRKS